MNRWSPRRVIQRGQAMVIVALMMTAMIGALALAIDGGRLYVERRAMQNADDAAALAMSDAYFGAVQAKSATPITTAFSAGLDEFAKGSGQTGTWASTGSVPAGCTVTATGSTYPPASAPGGGFNVVQYQLNGYTLLLSVWKSSVESQQGLCVFNAVASHSINTFFIQVPSQGAITSVATTVVASSVTAHIFVPPTLLVLDPTCGGATGTALKISGGGKVTVNGTTWSDGNITVSNNTAFAANGNVFDHCDNQAYVDGLPITYGSGAAGFGSSAQIPDPMLGFAGRFASTYINSYSATSPSDGEGSVAACNKTTFGCVQLEPGVYSNSNSFPAGCWFVEPGIYSWADTQNSGSLLIQNNSSVLSNELTPPDGINPATLNPAGSSAAPSNSTNSESPLFAWNLPISTPQSCLGKVKSYKTTALVPGTGPVVGTYYFRVSSVREERIGGRNFWRESYLSNDTSGSGCLPVTVTGVVPPLGDQTIEIGISNVPGMGNKPLLDGSDTTVTSEYHVYASTTGCDGPFGYVTKATTGLTTFRQTEDVLAKTSKVTGCPYLPTAAPVSNFSTDVDIAATPNVQCSLGYNGSTVIDATNLGLLWSQGGSACDPSNPARGCQPPYLSAPGSTDFSPDTANEDECIDTSGARCSVNPFPTQGGTTPGGALFYFPNTTTCMKQTQSAPFVYSGLQWESVSFYAQAPSGWQGLASSATDCGNGITINGSDGGQFIGIAYVPAALLTVLGTGTPIDGAIVVWQLVAGGASNTNLTGRFPRVTSITPGHLIDCTNGGVSSSTYCPNP